ncbi:hypothetical protein [Zooshikella ganghwensis]|uniref:hypothetical protein n=1 Tax=Zooshikella ganghwensis TaxID=202772 RepID=UPI0004074042|nr:hypothetical protein [Zooshikella ganghwensis]
MAHNVEYILDISGERFNQQLPSNKSATSTELEDCKTYDSGFEFTLPNTTVDLIGELTGNVTIIWTPWVYSSILRTPSILDKLADWEQQLLTFCPGVTTYRADEYLIELWEKEAGEYWFRDVNPFPALVKWLNNQEPFHWKKIN